ncbi:MAG: TMEM165/GDT1 family protein [Acidobacteriota bacterium]|nr:TMEM165/GDT1 family protein [Acidobacteriota bacterium]MDQ5871772.1 TMEM165/GDT1 family protein [Acidobacteriota bacterium]
MDMKLLMTVFATVFVAELGDKTQLSTMLYASGASNGKWTVFLGSALALVVSSALGVFAGALIGSRLDSKLLARIAGAGFIAVGIWTIARA